EATKFARAVSEERATMAWGVPAQLGDLCALRAPGGAAADLRYVLREVRTGGAPLPAEIARTLFERVAPEVVVQWGMSELGGGAMTLPGESRAAAPARAPVGRAFPGGGAKVVAAAGRALPAGAIGHLWYRRADMFRGY